MDEIEVVERRLREALGRIDARMTAIRSPDGEEDEGEIGRLSDLLQTEREALAQLEERYNRVRKRQTTQLRKLEAELEDATERAEAAEANAARLLAANERLREAAAQLREKAEDGAVNAKRINLVMKEELAALREARQADRDVLDRLMVQLAPFAEPGEDDETEEAS